jgi:hypothetical protein
MIRLMRRSAAALALVILAGGQVPGPPTSRGLGSSPSHRSSDATICRPW